MTDRGWLKVVLEKTRKDIADRPEWQRNRVVAEPSEPQCQPAQSTSTDEKTPSSK